MKKHMNALYSFVVPFVLVSTSALADGDAVKGKQLFSRCSACHSVDGRNKSGPALNGVVGRKAGSLPGFKYSPAMINSNVTWTDETLDRYLAGPSKMIQGGRMSVSVPKDQDRADLISYLKALPSQ